MQKKSYKKIGLVDSYITDIIRFMNDDKSIQKLEGFSVFYDSITSKSIGSIMSSLRNYKTTNALERLRDSCPRTIPKVLATKDGKPVLSMNDRGDFETLRTIFGYDIPDRDISFTISNGLEGEKGFSLSIASNRKGEIICARRKNNSYLSTTFYEIIGTPRKEQWLNYRKDLRTIYYNQDGSRDTVKNALESCYYKIAEKF